MADNTPRLGTGTPTATARPATTTPAPPTTEVDVDPNSPEGMQARTAMNNAQAELLESETRLRNAQQPVRGYMRNNPLRTLIGGVTSLAIAGGAGYVLTNLGPGDDNILADQARIIESGRAAQQVTAEVRETALETVSGQSSGLTRTERIQASIAENVTDVIEDSLRENFSDVPNLEEHIECFRDVLDATAADAAMDNDLIGAFNTHAGDLQACEVPQAQINGARDMLIEFTRTPDGQTFGFGR